MVLPWENCLGSIKDNKFLKRFKRGKQMFRLLKRWFYTKILKRQFVMGIDYSNGKDYSCKVYGYRDKNGVVHITDVKYSE